MVTFNIIAAVTHKTFGIGKNNAIPWNIPDDLAYFSKITKNSIVVMGRKTFESIPMTTALAKLDNFWYFAIAKYQKLSSFANASSSEFLYNFMLKMIILVVVYIVDRAIVFLGLPFNVASYAILTYIIAKLCDLLPKELTINTGDTHIYS